MYGFDTKGNTKHALFSYTKPGSSLRTTWRNFPFKVNRNRSHDEKRNCLVMFFETFVEDVNQEASSLFLFPGKCFFLVFALTSFSSLHLSYTLHLQIISMCVYILPTLVFGRMFKECIFLENWVTWRKENRAESRAIHLRSFVASLENISFLRISAKVLFEGKQKKISNWKNKRVECTKFVQWYCLKRQGPRSRLILLWQ